MVQAGFEPATLALLNATPTFEVGVAISILKSISTTLYQLSYRTAVRSNSTLYQPSGTTGPPGLPHAYHIESLTL